MATKTIIICDGCGKKIKKLYIYDLESCSVFTTLQSDCVTISSYSDNEEYHICRKCEPIIDNLVQKQVIRVEGWLKVEK